MRKKELIRQAAIKVMAKKGYHRAKVQTIADEAGIANGTVYLYFKNKQEILEYIYRVEINKRLESFDEIEKKNLTILEKLELFIRCYIREWENNLDVLKVLTQDNFSLIDCGVNPRKILGEIGTKLAKLLEEGYKLGELKDAEFHLFSLIIIDSLRCAIYEFNFGEGTGNYEIKKERLISFILDGLKR